MSSTIFLDSSPLGLITNPKLSPASLRCTVWLDDLIGSGHRIVVAEIIDYEIRRELLRARKTAGLARLDHFTTVLEFLPITTLAMRRAAELWAEARQKGYSTAGDKAIDADVILAAQALTFGGANIIIATTNVDHLSRFAPAALWSDIH